MKSLTLVLSLALAVLADGNSNNGGGQQQTTTAQGKSTSQAGQNAEATSQAQSRSGQSGQNAAGSKSSSASTSTSTANVYSGLEYVLGWENLGYSGTYYDVSKVEATDDGCSCALDKTTPFSFSGALAPMDEPLSVHIRGPINLLKFAYYTIDSYSSGDTTGEWTRGAYYNAEDGTADNVTFLANVGTNNTCLGQALNYVTWDDDTSTLEQADDSEVLGNITLGSDQEFAIYSGTECADSSSQSGDCGVYRSGIDAYQGFSGTNKAFFFEFSAPSDLSEEDDENKTASYDMPAVWLLNAKIARTSQYPTNANCSSWNSGAGEFDIFEVMNVTERNHFYSTIHTFQGISDIETGIQMFGYLERTPDDVMRGGVVFGEDKSATVFLSNDTTFESTFNNTDLNSWLSDLESTEAELDETLATVTAVASTSTSKAGGAAAASFSVGGAMFAWLISCVLL